MRPEYPSFGIIGAGFSGSLLAIHLLRGLSPRGRIHLIERRPGFGRGLAYSTGNPSHLLNVRAARMSAFEDDPDHFLRWLSAPPPAMLSDGGAFVPREVYGRYVQSLLSEELRGEAGGSRLFITPDEAEELSLDERGVTIHMGSGRPLRVDVAVLAVGNFPSELPRGAAKLAESNRYLSDPWDDKALSAIPPRAPLLVIGTGLTMVDLVLELLDRGHRGPITAISRRGLLPHSHQDGAPPISWADFDRSQGMSRLLREVRQRADGADWRAAVDGLRPYLQDWWQAMSSVEKRRFLRHLRPWWDIHRHRMAPMVADRLDGALGSGQLRVIAGQIVGIRQDAEGVDIAYRRRNARQTESLAVETVVNCSGPCSDYARITQPLVRQLLDSRMARPDALRLGLDVDSRLRLLDGSGQPQARLYALGPVTRGRFWECTAVPEIRRQAKWLADHLVGEAFLDPAAWVDGAIVSRPLSSFSPDAGLTH